MIRMTMSEKDYDTLATALGTLDAKIRDWIQSAADRESFDHYMTLRDDLEALKARYREAERVRA